MWAGCSLKKDAYEYEYGGIILAGVRRGGSFEFIMYGWYLIHFSLHSNLTLFPYMI